MTLNPVSDNVGLAYIHLLFLWWLWLVADQEVHPRFSCLFTLYGFAKSRSWRDKDVYRPAHNLSCKQTSRRAVHE